MPSSKTSTRTPRLPHLDWTRIAVVTCLVGGLLLLGHAQDAGLADITQSIPVGVENEHAVLPSFDETGRRSSLITADVIRRIDDERLYAEGFQLEQYGSDKDHDTRINLSTAYYNMTTGTLRSTQRSKVSRADFEIEGDSLIFDTQNNRGLMQGNIRMVIFDSSSDSHE